MAMVALSEIKTYLSIAQSDTTQDDLLNLLNSDAQAVVESYCRRRFEQTTYTEFYSGTGTRIIVLRQRPVLSITNVWLDNGGYYGQGTGSPFSSTSLLTAGVDYALELDETLPNAAVVSRAGLLMRVSTVWPELNPFYYPGRLTQEYGPAFGNIKVTYVAGYPSGYIPSDLKRAVRVLVTQARKDAPFGGSLTSEKISDYSYTLSESDLDAKVPGVGTVRSILNRYREIAVGETSASAPGSGGR